MLNIFAVILILAITGFTLFVLLNHYLFHRQLMNEIKSLSLLTTEEMTLPPDKKILTGLPEPVYQYFEYCKIIDHPPASFVRMKHKGSFRTDPGQKWMPVKGEEYFSVNHPGFIWFAQVKPAPLFWIQARDRYVKGEGRMTVKLWSTFTIGDPKGEKLDISSLLRYLLEMPLFPVSFMSSHHVQWESIDKYSAKAIIHDHDRKASGTFSFDDEGKVTYATTNDRYREQKGQFRKQKWSASYKNYREMNGVMIPTETEVSWEDGDETFTYARFIITDVTYL
jgi:hypothetical protein